MLKIENLVLRYANKRGLGPFSLCARHGEVIGIIGPNGAGKSTLFTILSGINKAQSGTIYVENEGVTPRIPLAYLGYLPETPLLMERFTARQSVRFEAAMRARPMSVKEADKHLDSFDAYPLRNQSIRTLSQGQSKRVELACAFLGSPDILVLDEPLNGLDIQSVINLREKIFAEKERGATILISSHILTFIDEVADRIIFLDDGHIVGEVDPREQDAESAYRHLFLS